MSRSLVERWGAPLVATIAVATSCWQFEVVPGIHVDVGAALIPTIIALFGLVALRRELGSTLALFGMMVVAFHFLSQQDEHGVVIAMWAGAALAGITATGVSRARAGIVAYVVSTLGALVGADLLHAVPIGATAVIGGAGVSDVILLVGPVAATFAVAARSWLP